MKMNFNLNLVQTQKLVMTPELKQAIEILQFTSLELNEFIQEEMLNNPILQSDVPAEPISQEKTETDTVEDIYDKIDWKDVENDYRDENRMHGSKIVKDEVNYDNFVASEDTLADHLLFQLQFIDMDKASDRIAKYLIENIDTNGYLDINEQYVISNYAISQDKLEDIIDVIQGFEPYGVGARSLEECLLIQLKQQAIGDEVAEKVIENHLDDLGNNRLSSIAKSVGCSIDDVKEAVCVIKTLEPKPGRIFSSMRDVRYIVPDVVVKKVDGEYVVVVSESSAPKLNINKFYKSMLNSQETNPNAALYINKKLTSALKLIKSIEQRRNTIYRVVQAIIDHQYDFFEKGTIHLKTLTLKEIADEIGVHESTVSRAVNGKYMQCPCGLYEIKYFFQSGVSSVYGDGVSAESIKTIIKDLVDKENQKKPVSDQFISDELNKVGIKISRRTVAKYRDEMGILSSSKRKEY